MSKISILDLEITSESDNFLTDLSDAELNISGGGKCYYYKKSSYGKKYCKKSSYGKKYYKKYSYGKKYGHGCW
jgi:hypothetical protein